MLLIFGGAYQGKRDYAKCACGLSDDDIFLCAEAAIDPDFPAIAGLEAFSLACVDIGREPIDELRRQCPDLSKKVLIADDISCGVVPTDPVLRAWREAHGRMLNALAKEADGVVRLFCGLPQVLK